MVLLSGLLRIPYGTILVLCVSEWGVCVCVHTDISSCDLHISKCYLNISIKPVSNYETLNKKKLFSHYIDILGCQKKNSQPPTTHHRTPPQSLKDMLAISELISFCSKCLIDTIQS